MSTKKSSYRLAATGRKRSTFGARKRSTVGGLPKRVKTRVAKPVHDIANLKRPSLDFQVTAHFRLGEHDSSLESSSERDFADFEEEEEKHSGFSLDILGLTVQDLDDEEYLENYFEKEDESEDTFEEYDYLKEGSLQEERDILQEISQVPNIEDIEEDPEEEIVVVKEEEKTPKKKIIDPNAGQFLDPLTGKELPKPPPPPPPPSVVDTVVVQQEGEDGEIIEVVQAAPVKKVRKRYIPRLIGDEESSEEEESELSFSELLEMDRKLAIELGLIHETPEEGGEDIMKAIVIIDEHLESQLEAIEPKISFEELKRLEEERKLLEAIASFFHDLITTTVDYCEQVARETLLRKKLDKRKIAKDLIIKYRSLTNEKQNALFLEKKVVEVYRKRKMWKNLTTSPVPDSPMDLVRYHKLLDELDMALGREKETRDRGKIALQKAYEERHLMGERYAKAIHNWESLLAKLVRREEEYYLKKEIGRAISTIRVNGEKLTVLRRKIIEQQHVLGTYVFKMNNLSDLCGDINFNDYQKFTLEIAALQTKIEEKDYDMRKKRARLGKEMHLYAHILEKKIMGKNLVSLSSSAYDEMKEQSEDLKEELRDIGVDRIMIQSNTQVLLEKGALLHRPDLLREYDNIMERIHVKRNNVNNLKSELSDLEGQYGKLLRYIKNECCE